MDKLKPCPFCGAKIKIVICDDEGNIHDTEYEKNLGVGWATSCTTI